MKKLFIIIIAIVMALVVVSCSSTKDANTAQESNTSASTAKATSPAAEDGRLRIEAAKTVDSIDTSTMEGRIKVRLIESWANWQPDYEGWLKWSDDLYASDAIIDAIGGEKLFKDYQKSMKAQRDANTMEMGPIATMEVTGNIATITYNMYLTPKDNPEKTRKIIVKEINKFEEIDGVLKVVRLDLSTYH